MTEQQLLQMRQDVDALISYADTATVRFLGLEKAGTQAMAEANRMFEYILRRIDELKNRLDTLVPGG